MPELVGKQQKRWGGEGRESRRGAEAVGEPGGRQQLWLCT